MDATFKPSLTSLPAESATALSVRDLHVRLGGQEILRGINLDLRQGEFVSCVGRSGSGKSTLINAIMGFIPLASGDVRRPPNTAVVLQTYAVFPWLTVTQNVAFGLKHFPKAKRAAEVKKMIQLAGLQGKERSYPAQLSGGQVQRVALARALATDTPAVLADEPFGALDLLTREECTKWLLDIWQARQKTILLTTHSQDEAILLSDRVIVMFNGEISGDFSVNLPRPRNDEMRYLPEFAMIRAKVRAAMAGTPESLLSQSRSSS